MVKRALYIFIPFIVVMLAIIVSDNMKNDTLLVSKEIDNNMLDNQIYNIFFLNLEEYNITTKNFESYFKNDDIISITPYVNPIYKKKINSNLKYNFKHTSIFQNITNFERYYEKVIKESGYIKDLSMISYEGIKINEICLYEKVEIVNELLKKYPKIKYRHSQSERYRNL